jgi:alpha-glucosidase
LPACFFDANPLVSKQRVETSGLAPQDSVKTMPGNKSSEDWWRGGVIYQIYPRGFADSNGDGVGDLAGIAGKLPYVASLGVDAIWISPVFKSPMKGFGYDVSDRCDVDPLFGDLRGFDAVVMAAGSASIV